MTRQVLDAIGRRLGLDKSSLCHGYLAAYELMLESKRDSTRTLLEITANLNSGRMWAEYFKTAQIVIVIAVEQARAQGVVVSDFEVSSGGRIKLEIGDLRDRDFICEVSRKYSPDIVIDDGSHFADEQIMSFDILFDVVTSGGLYIVEDTQTNFAPHRDAYVDPSKASLYDYMIDIANFLSSGFSVNKEYSGLGPFNKKFINSVRFLRQICIVEKERFTEITVKSLAETGAVTHLLNEGSKYDRIKPHIYNAPAYVVDGVRLRYDARLAIAPASMVAELDNAIVRGPGFIQFRDSFISESLLNLIGDTNLEHYIPVERQADGRLLAKNRDLAPQEIISERCVLLKQNADVNYGHWMVEGLPRIALIAKLYDISTLKFIVCAHEDNHMNNVYVDTLRMFGVEKENIIFLGGHSVQFESLIYPAPLTIQPWVKAPCVIETLRDLGEKLIAQYPDEPRREKIYVTRNQFGKRKLLNEVDIISFLQKEGYHVVAPESLDVTQQILHFASAKYVIGNLGGALSNIAFSPQNLRLFALTTQYMNDDFFWDIVCHKKGEYISLHGNATDPHNGMQSDFYVDMEQFKCLFEMFEHGSTAGLCDALEVG